MTNNMVPIEKVTTFSANNAESMINYFGIESVFINKKPGTRILNGLGTVHMYRYVIHHYNANIEFSFVKDMQACEKYNLIDLGSDGNTFIIKFAQNLNLPGLVCVDICKQFSPGTKNLTGDLPVLGIKMDMLAFLENLPNKCANISMFAIDTAIAYDKEYRKEMYYHLNRVVPDDGVVFSVDSIIEYHSGFESVGLSCNIYRKKR
ncbi:MAG: hypothetical protein R3B64_01225 [Candidatus Paceibacterota bacterium]